jgi:transcriptional regulator with PAS, ATPase and Fis domain
VKNHVFSSIINDSSAALIITNEKYHVIFSNDKARKLFNIKDSSSLDDIFSKELFSKIEEDAVLKNKIMFNEMQYFIEKTPIMLIDETMGYYISFQNEKDIRDMEINAKNLLENKGLFAKYTFSDIIHVSPIMKECINKAKTVALTDHTILIIGDSGTGKELMAQSIHNYSKRKNMSFVAINCAALPETLLESELFGYESGAFTGARKGGKVGLFEQANGGTIFLDEIGDISQNLQSRLLRVLQERQIMRIGSDRMINIDTRIIAATNIDLKNAVEIGDFRKDLYYRLNVISLKIQPLNRRKQDILPLMESFLGEKYNQLTDIDKSILFSYPWPGNVRELESAAIHYNTLSVLPRYMLENYKESLDQNSSSIMDSDYIKKEILKIIMDNTQLFSGIGRTLLNKKLRSLNINIGDSNLRVILNSLQEDKFITIGKGREGMRITEIGIDKIKKE